MQGFLEFLSLEEGAVPAHMQGKQKPYVSSDGKGNFEVLGNKGQTKATFSRAEHGKDAQKKAQAHLKSKYNEYMKEEVELTEASDKAEQLRQALERHSQKAMAANKAGDDEACKVHQGYMNKIKDKMAKLARNEEVELDDIIEEGYVSDAQRKAVWASRNDEKTKKEETIPFDKPYTKIKGNVKDKSGAVHTPMSRARDLARSALKKSLEKKKDVKEELKDTCWKGYEAIGMKTKNGKKVPNCVPVKKEETQTGE